jgi:hypothetical protein
MISLSNECDMKDNQLKHSSTLFNIKEFNEKPGAFCMSFGFENKTLISSIEKIGLINKPYVRRNKQGALDIVTGYRRILALKALNWDMVPCIEITDSGLSEMDMLILNLYDNQCTRSFNDVEKHMIISRLLNYVSLEEINERYLGLLNISSRREVDLLRRIEGIPEELMRTIADGLISIKTLALLLNMKDPEISIIIKFIKELKLNFNQQILFIEYINDISIREGKGILEYLNEDAFAYLLIEDGRNTPQKAKKFLDLLRAKRYPILTKNEKAFTRMITEINLPENAKVKHPPFFEGSDYILEISFKEGKKLKQTIDQIARIKGIEDIKDPWAKE